MSRSYNSSPPLAPAMKCKGKLYFFTYSLHRVQYNDHERWVFNLQTPKRSKVQLNWSTTSLYCSFRFTYTCICSTYIICDTYAKEVFDSTDKICQMQEELPRPMCLNASSNKWFKISLLCFLNRQQQVQVKTFRAGERHRSTVDFWPLRSFIKLNLSVRKYSKKVLQNLVLLTSLIFKWLNVSTV